MTHAIITTARLHIREFTIEDAPFIIDLLNSKTWINFIGDKGVQDIQDAEQYLKEGPINSYNLFGYGLWMVELKDGSTPIGMCGFLNRDTLDNPDIGFALLPEYENFGYAFEMTSAVMTWGSHKMHLDEIVAITTPVNSRSISLLEKIGLNFKKPVTLAGDQFLLFSNDSNQTDQKQIDALTKSFFSCFTNVDRKTPDLDKLRELLIPQALITNNSKEALECYTVESFIFPREKLLTDGTLTDFSESEISHKTQFFGKIAERFSLYQKSGVLQGSPFETYGMKTIQFVKKSGQWKISAVAWDDFG